MATNYNYFGNLVTNGLVLDLDAAKLDSYPGSGTTWRDISGNNLTGSLINGPTFSGIGKSASIVFDGTNDYINIPSISFPASASFTLNSWVYFASGSGQWPMIANAGNLNLLFGIQIGTGAYTGFNLFLGSTSLETNNVGRPLFNQWYHVVGNYDGSRARLYINGSPTSVSSPAVFPGASGFTLANGSAGGNSYWKGNIPSTQVYNRALSQFEVWQNFNAIKGRYGIPDIVTNGLVLNLDAGNPYSYLSGSSGTTWTNTVAVSSSISGALVNGTTYANGAMVFDGTNDECNIGNVLFNSASATTIDLWVNIPSMAVNNYIMSKGSAGDGIYTFILYTGLGPSGGSSSYIRFAMGNQSGSVSSVIEYNYLNFNQWYNFTFTYDGSFVRGYQNAASPQSSSLSGNLYTTTTPIYLGRSKYGNFAPSSISNFKIYNRALTQAEITQNFNALRGRYGI